MQACGGLIYLDGGIRQSTYKEKPKEGNLESVLSTSTNRSVIITEGNKSSYSTSGLGPHYGLSYESQFFMQKYNYYKIDYDVLNYSYSIDGSIPVYSPLRMKAKGHDYMLGLKLGYFRPRISFKQEDLNIDSLNGVSNVSFFYIGYGIGIDFHLIKGLHLYAGLDKRMRLASDPLVSISTTDITFGVLIRPWDWISFKSSRPKPKFFSNPFFSLD